jgi:hypothetical protein
MEEGKNKSSAYSVVIIGVVAAFLAIPLFIFTYKFFPSIEFTLNEKLIRLDHIVLFMALFFVLYYLLKKLKMLVYILVFGSVLLFTVTNFSNIYTFDHLKRDYSAFLYDLSNNSLEHSFFNRELKFYQEDRLRTAIDYSEPEVRNYAVNIANKHFESNRQLSDNLKWVHFFSVFKEVHEKWNYVFDPLSEEYYSSASETIKQLDFDDQFKGDCDDHSILMAACLKAVGGEVRLVRTKVTMSDGREVGHLYPEVKFGNTKDLERVVYLIKNVFFVEETKDKTIHYYQDPKGLIWLNFDYNDKYPGNKYQSDIRESEIEI